MFKKKLYVTAISIVRVNRFVGQLQLSSCKHIFSVRVEKRECFDSMSYISYGSKTMSIIGNTKYGSIVAQW